jgi:hypothetical protein
MRRTKSAASPRRDRSLLVRPPPRAVARVLRTSEKLPARRGSATRQLGNSATRRLGGSAVLRHSGSDEVRDSPVRVRCDRFRRTEPPEPESFGRRSLRRQTRGRGLRRQGSAVTNASAASVAARPLAVTLISPASSRIGLQERRNLPKSRPLTAAQRDGP